MSCSNVRKACLGTAAVVIASVGVVGPMTVGTHASMTSSSASTVSEVPTTRTATFNGTVLALAASHGTVYVGGDFSRATDASGTVTRHNLAAVNAATGQLGDGAPARMVSCEPWPRPSGRSSSAVSSAMLMVAPAFTWPLFLRRAQRGSCAGGATTQQVTSGRWP